MKYKALFLDLDGTTCVNVKHGLPTEKVKNAIFEASKKIKICIATGRGQWELDGIFDFLKPNGLCVLLNGVQIYDPVNKKVVKEILLKKSVIPQVSQMLKKYKTNVFCFDGTKESLLIHKKTYQKLCSFYIPRIPEKIADKIIKEASQIAHVITHKLISTVDKTIFSVEITDTYASKMHGIMEIAKLLNIKTHEIIGVGDGYNDFPLLMACGYKVAMGNAVSDLKEIADYVAPSVLEDGVAHVIDKFILKK